VGRGGGGVGGGGGGGGGGAGGGAPRRWVGGSVGSVGGRYARRAVDAAELLLESESEPECGS
jgi:hypothetical protein